MSSCNFTNAPALTVMVGLVLAVLLPSLTSLAVTVREPTVLSVMLKLPVPLASAAFAGKVALLSEEVIPTVSLTVGTMFQFASPALIVTLNADPAVRAVGAPVLPVALPGEAVSPGTRSCNLANAPAFARMAALVLAAIPVCVVSEAVTVALPLVLSVTLKVRVPLDSAPLAGRTAFASDEVIPTAAL